MQFQVPQNIAMEDRIVGSLTPIQFGIVVLGGGFAFFVFTSTSLPSPINQAGGLLLAFFTLIMALGKYNDQPMYRFIRYIISFIFTPKIRIWHKSGFEAPLIRPNPNIVHKEQTHTVKNISREDIARLAVVLDSRGADGRKPKITIPAPTKPTGK